MHNEQLIIYTFLQLKNLKDAYKFITCCKMFYDIINQPHVCREFYRKLFMVNNYKYTCEKRLKGIVNLNSLAYECKRWFIPHRFYICIDRYTNTYITKELHELNDVLDLIKSGSCVHIISSEGNSRKNIRNTSLDFFYNHCINITRLGKVCDCLHITRNNKNII